ncbi:MAG: class I SAM-dependent methyltransferase [Jatrophihabitans sp.]
MPTDTHHDRPGTGRLGLVVGLLCDALGNGSEPGSRLQVLDCGGGSGAYSVPLAEFGADVTVVDLSADALATLRRRAEEAGVSASVTAIAGDVEALAGLVRPGGYDAVLAHGILDAVDQVESTFAAMAEAVRPGGLMSVLVGNPIASVLARALAGDPAAALAELRGLDAAESVDAAVIATLAARFGLIVEARHGIGVFSDLVPGAAGDTAAGRAALAALDVEAAGRLPFAELAGRIHLLLRRPNG